MVSSGVSLRHLPSHAISSLQRSLQFAISSFNASSLAGFIDLVREFVKLSINARMSFSLTDETAGRVSGISNKALTLKAGKVGV